MKTKLIEGDCMTILKKLKENSVDSCITDPRRMSNINNILYCLELVYEIKSNGVVINKRTGKELSFSLDKKGYKKTRLYTPLSKNKDGRIPYRLHRLVAMKYLKDFKQELTVNHKDGNKLNNDVSNLEMMTNKENMRHAYRVLGRKNNHLTRNEKGQFCKK